MEVGVWMRGGGGVSLPVKDINADMVVDIIKLLTDTSTSRTVSGISVLLQNL